MSRWKLQIPPLAVWAAHALASIAAAHALPSGSWPFLGHSIVAAVLALLGLGVTLAAVVEFRRAKTTVNPLTPEKAVQIVTSGVFQRSRNPMYLGLAILLLGVAAWWASLIGLLFVATFCAYITIFQIRLEERALLARFGQPYADYKSRVRRWL